MAVTSDNLLITGPPGVGKTTLIRRLAQALKTYRPVGFYTEEIREGGVRKGFALVDFSGRRSVLSHVDIRSPYRVGKYGVDLPALEAFLEGIDFSRSPRPLCIIDEIGKMECFSPRFRQLVTGLLDSPKPVVATIAVKGGGFIAEVKRRPDIRLITLSRENRDRVLEELIQSLRAMLSPAAQ
ncbi:MAG: NTPase [Calditrichaeota bacterium]|nr:MAG: NTPase [Calditrichota bacterium]